MYTRKSIPDTRTLRQVAAALAALLVLTGMPVFADAAISNLETRQRFDIPAQPLDTALLAFSDQAHIQVLMWAGARSDTRSPGAVGGLRALDALRALLENTGLTFQAIDETTVAIRPAGSAAQGGEAATAAGGARRTSQTLSPLSFQGVRALPKAFRLAQAEGATRGGAGSSGAPASPDDSPLGGEVIVTAQRTESFESKTPIALTAIGGDALRTAGVTNPLMLAQQVPNLAINRARGMQITIRGVTSTDGTEKGDPSAAFLLDGVYIARAQAQEVSFFDISRVEVLRGPQGTLYGRNTTAGVVNIITNRPTHEFEAAVNGSLADFGTRQVDAMVNVPVNDRFALRAAVAYDRRDNYIDQAVPSAFGSQDPFKDTLSGRLQGLLSLSEDASLLLRADYSRLKGNPTEFGANSVRVQTVFDVSDPRNPVYVGNDRDLLKRTYAPTGKSTANDNTWGVSAELNWLLGPVTLTYLGAYRELTRDDGTVGAIQGVPNHGQFDGDYWQNSQELRIASALDGPFNAQAGLYYFKERSGIILDIFDLLPNNTFFAFPQNPTISESYAPFGQLTYTVRPELRLTAGVRYSHDDKSRVGATVRRATRPSLDGFVFNPATDNLNSAAITSSKVTWRGGIDYDLNDRSLLYGSIATGYKAGGFNDGCEIGTTTNGVLCNQPRPLTALYYNPETLTAYEIGFKTRFADNHVRLNGAGFYYDYKNLQLSTTGNCAVAGQPAQPCQVTSNAAKAKVKGIELEGTLAPNLRNRLDLTATWLDASYAEYVPISGGPNYAGRPLDRAPKYTVAAGYTYTYPFANQGSLAATLRSRFSDSFVLTNTGLPAQYRQPSFTTTDVSLTYSAPEDRWYLQGYVHNLEDEIVLMAVDGNGNATPGDPRTYGLRTGVRF